MENILLKSSMSGFRFLVLGIERFDINEFENLESDGEMMDYIHQRKGEIIDLDICDYLLEDLIKINHIKNLKVIESRF